MIKILRYGEIPDEQIRHTEQADRTAWTGSRRYGRRGTFSIDSYSSYHTPSVPAAKPSAANTLSLSPGDVVEHKAFGRGVVRSLRNMAGDTLVEVEFENSGVKRLMLNYAGAHMRKL